MDYRRACLNMLYISLFGWFAFYALAQAYFLGTMLLISYPFLYIIPIIGLLLAIVMFSMTKKWISEERLLSLLLILPFLIATVIPTFASQIELNKTPTETMIRSHYESTGISQPQVFDLTTPLSRFDERTKTLELHIKIVPELFAAKLSSWEELNAETAADSDFAHYFMNNLKLSFIHHAAAISEINLRSRQIIVLGYWGTEQVLNVHMNKKNNEYVIAPPAPNLRLVEEKGKAELLYLAADGKKSIQVYDRQNVSASRIQIDLTID